MRLDVVASASNHFSDCSMLIPKAAGRLVRPLPLIPVEHTDTFELQFHLMFQSPVLYGGSVPQGSEQATENTRCRTWEFELSQSHSLC